MITIKGSNNIISKEYNVSSFLHLHLSVNGLVELYQSDEEKVTVEADENLMAYISVINAGKTLFVASEAGYRKLDFSSFKMKIYFRQITKLNIRCEDAQVLSRNTISLISSLDVRIQGAANTDLDLDVLALKIFLQNEGDTILRGRAVDADIKTQSEGNLFAKNLHTSNCRLKNMSEGNIEISADDTISISHYGEGFIHYYGKARLTNLNQKGNGEIKHLNQIYATADNKVL